MITSVDLMLTGLLTLFRMTFQNNDSTRGGAKTPSPPKCLLRLLFWGVHHIIALGHKWKAYSHKISPLTLKFLVLELNKNSGLELVN